MQPARIAHFRYSQNFRTCSKMFLSKNLDSIVLPLKVRILDQYAGFGPVLCRESSEAPGRDFVKWPKKLL